MQPLLYDTSAFDATQDWTFDFSYQGSQVFKNRLIIRDNQSNTSVYDKTVTSFQLRHTVSARSLTNGKLYNAEVQVFDKDNNASSFSRRIIFYCFANPSFGFSNLTSDQIIKNSSYTLELSYTQPQNEPLNSYQVILYDIKQQELWRSSMHYSSSKLSISISSLLNNTAYYVQATGETLNRMKVDTGLIPIYVEYIKPEAFNTVQLSNEPEQYSVKIASNIISILGTSNPDPPKYIDNEMVDLTQDGSWVKFDEGFNIEKDFTLQITGRNFKSYQPFLELENLLGQNIEVKYMKGIFEGQLSEKAYIELQAFNSITSYYLTSNYLAVPSPADLLVIWIRRVNNVYTLKAGYKGGTS